jgi:hypothetical protein
MVTRGNRKEVDRSLADRYRRVGASLIGTARVMAELASDSDNFGNAIAVVAVHACIAYNDALSIAWRGVKSTGGDHLRAADTLVFALGHLAAAEQVRRLRAVLSTKDQVSYQGSYYRVSEAAPLLEQASRFCAWAEELYDHRPPG